MKRTIHRSLAAVFATTFVLGTFPGMAAAENAPPTADLTIALLSKYVWRGYELSKNSLVIQPSLTAAYKGIGVNLWGNLDTDQNMNLYGTEGANWNETDMTISYDNAVGMINYSLGYIYYGLDGADDTQELYGSFAFDTILAPSLTIYRDISSFPGWYTTLAVSHTFELSEQTSLDLGGHVSYMSADDASTLADPSDPTSSYSEFHDGQVFVSVSIPVAEYITIVPELYYSFPLSSAASDVIKAGSADGDDSFLYGGVSLNMAF